MTRFQLVFKDPNGDRSELRDNNAEGAPMVEGKLIVDGEVFRVRGVEWMPTREESEGLTRFVCTLVAESAGTLIVAK